LYNGSNARTYRLAWQDGTPLLVLGTDGGLLPKPVQRSYVMLAPAERVDLWVDFSDKPEGTELVMQSLQFQTGMGGMMGVLTQEQRTKMREVIIRTPEKSSLFKLL